MSDSPTPPVDSKDEFGDGNASENWAKVRDKGNLLKDQGLAFWSQWNLQQRMMAGGALVAALFTVFPWYSGWFKVGDEKKTISSDMLGTWNEWVGLGLAVLAIALLVSPKVRSTIAGFIPADFRAWTYSIVAGLGFILAPMIFWIRADSDSGEGYSRGPTFWFYLAALGWLCCVGGAVWKALLDQGMVKTSTLSSTDA